jgi:alcohol dehydrogenase
MKAVLYQEFRKPPEITDVQDPTPPRGGVVIEVRSTGLCLSDWHGWMGHDPDIELPHIPGHELAGVVAEVDNQVRNWKKGDKVTLPFVGGCGQCTYCLEANPQVCDYQFQPGFTSWGSFAPYVAIKYADFNLVRIPEYLNFESASILGCRFATSFRALVDQGKVKQDQWVAVYGCGGIGLSAIMIAVALGARVIAIDLSPSKLQFAKKLGAEHTVLVPDQSPVESVKSITGNGAHLSIDAVGKAEIVGNSIASLRKGGIHIQVGLMDPEEKEVSVPFDRLIAEELHLMGSHGIQTSRYDAIFYLIANGKLDPGALITRRISLSESIDELINLNKKSDPGITIINDFRI